jgi:hypothetical protein
MRCRAASLPGLILIASACFGPCFAQTPPPDVDAALRSRVKEFMGYHITGEFMKAFGLVAEDTREYYFGTQKNQFLSFEIGDISYSDDFTKAVVEVQGKRKIRLSAEFPETIVDQPMKMTWKIENGKWVWYVKMTLECPTPMSCDPHGKPWAQQQAQAADNAIPLPKLDQKSMDDAAKKILTQSTLDKPNIAFTAGVASSERVVFHNGAQGGVKVYVEQPEVPGLTATIEKNDVLANEDVAINLHWQPGKGDPPLGLTVKVDVEPFGQVFPIAIRFQK